MCQTIVRHCLACSKQIPKTKPKDAKFCSAECYRSPEGKLAYNKVKPKTIRLCHRCGEQTSKLHGKNRAGERSDKVFCSRACYDADRRDGWKSIAKPCENCGKVSDDNATSARTKVRFCSIECRNDFKMPPPVNCLICGVLFSAIKWRRAGGYARDRAKRTCSRICLSEFMKTNQERKDKISSSVTGELHPLWEGGSKSKNFRGSGWGRLSESVRAMANYKCEHCGKTQEDNGRKLDVNHKIPFFQWGNKNKANCRSNLEALCKSCHRIADAKWKRENPTQITMDIFS